MEMRRRRFVARLLWFLYYILALPRNTPL